MRLNGKSVCFKKQKHSVLLINSFFIYISFLGHVIKKALTLTHSVRCFTKVHPKDRTRVNRQITNVKENQNHLSPVSLSTIGGFCSRGLFPLVSVRISAN